MTAPAFDPAIPTSFPLALLRQDSGGAEAGAANPAGGETGAVGVQTGEAGAPAPSATTGARPKAPAPGWFQLVSNPLVPLILLLAVFWIFTINSNRKRDRQRQDLINSLARGDRVVTVGGVIGSVVDAAGDEVVLKIDENNNTKMRITRAAVATVTRAGEAGEKK